MRRELHWFLLSRQINVKSVNAKDYVTCFKPFSLTKLTFCSIHKETQVNYITVERVRAFLLIPCWSCVQCLDFKSYWQQFLPPYYSSYSNTWERWKNKLFCSFKRFQIPLAYEKELVYPLLTSPFTTNRFQLHRIR